MTFDHEVMLRQSFTDKLDVLQSAVDKAKNPGKETALYDAIWHFTDEMLRNAPGRHIIVVISDGNDTISRANLDDVIDSAQRTETTIFAVSTRAEILSPAINAKAEATALKSDKELIRMCRETGGQTFFAGDALALDKAFQKIVQELQSQYVITYRPTNQNYDGRPRKIEVRFADENKGKEMTIRTKPSYRAVLNTSKQSTR
jgi:Ca-activated chloride channel family protein